MELEEFISVTLNQIISGVKASKDVEENKDLISPQVFDRSDHAPKGKYFISQINHKPVQMVSFDVAVTTEEGKERKEGIGVMVLGIGLGSQGKEIAQGTNVSRIKFEVPITFP